MDCFWETTFKNHGKLWNVLATPWHRRHHFPRRKATGKTTSGCMLTLGYPFDIHQDWTNLSKGFCVPQFCHKFQYVPMKLSQWNYPLKIRCWDDCPQKKYHHISDRHPKKLIIILYNSYIIYIIYNSYNSYHVLVGGFNHLEKYEWKSTGRMTSHIWWKVIKFHGSTNQNSYPSGNLLHSYWKWPI